MIENCIFAQDFVLVCTNPYEHFSFCIGDCLACVLL